MRRPAVLVSVWVVSTLSATLIAWAAVSRVTEQVAPQRVLPLPTTAAVAELSSPAAPGGDQPAADKPSQPTATDPAPVAEPYELTGGVVTVRYSGSAADLVEASPESGFVAEVNAGGPDKVDVRFRSDDHESRFVTRIRNGRPAPQREERSR